MIATFRPERVPRLNNESPDRDPTLSVPARRWGTAIGVPGLEALNVGGFAEVNWASCTSAGTCAAGGFYTDQDQHPQGFVAAERNGLLSTGADVPACRQG